MTDWKLTFYRTYVAAQWPLDPKPLGRTLEDMHRRIVAASKAKADAGAASKPKADTGTAGATSSTNGNTAGLATPKPYPA